MIDSQGELALILHLLAVQDHSLDEEGGREDSLARCPGPEEEAEETHLIAVQLAVQDLGPLTR